MLNLFFWTCTTTMVLFVSPILLAVMGIEELTSTLVGRHRAKLDAAEPESELMRDFAESLQVPHSADRVNDVRHHVAPVDKLSQEPERRTA
jgi:hypothetical protein